MPPHSYLGSMQLQRLFDIPRFQLERYPKADAIATKENGEWRTYSIHEVIATSERLGLGPDRPWV